MENFRIVAFVVLVCFLVEIADAYPNCPAYQTSHCCKRRFGRCREHCTETHCHGGGQFYCTCPGTKQAVHYNIQCTRGHGCVPANGGKSCDKYRNCATCRGGVGEWDGGCASCMTGYQLVSGWCHQDINECQQGKCPQLCTNTIGSYYCSCRPGFRLHADRHTCNKLECGDPGAIKNGIMEPVNNGSFLFDSYVRYSCNFPFTLVGNSVRRCIVNSSGNMTWTGIAPQCFHPSWTSGSVEMRYCGAPLSTSERCSEAGCIHVENDNDTTACYHKEDRPYLVYQGETPADQAVTTMAEYIADGCSIMCTNTPWCTSFVINKTHTDTVPHQDCQLYNETRQEYLNGDRMEFGAESIDFHQPLKFDGLPVGINWDMLYVGCFDVNQTPTFKSSRVWSASINSVERCIATCRQQSYSVAALRNGNECYCVGDVEAVNFVSGRSSECNKQCIGRLDQICGGANSYSVYRVPSDSRFIGCYNDKVGDPDLTTLMWTSPVNHSASGCIEQCLKNGSMYAALQNGSRCYCGNSYGRHGDVHYDKCPSKCAEKTRENCGGPTTNAVYATGLAILMTSTLQQHRNARHLFHADSRRLVQIPLQLFTEYSFLRAITTDRFILRVSESILTPSEQEACSPNCYKDCGDISPYDTQTLEYKGSDQVARFFHINLADLVTYVGKDAQRVFVYAQTVVIDTNLVFPFSLQVYTRQLVLDRYKAKFIRVSSTSPTLNVDFKKPTTLGVEMDSMFQKQSLMCARILLDTREQNNVNTAWAILYNLAHSIPSKDVERSAWMSGVRMFNTFLSGVDRQNIHFIPFYSKEFFREILRLHKDRVTLYKNDFDKLLDSSLSLADYTNTVSGLIKIHTSSSVSETKSAYDAAVTAVVRSSATYSRLRMEYDVASDKVSKTGDSLRQQRSFKRSLTATEAFLKMSIFIAKTVVQKHKKEDIEERRREAEQVQIQLQQALNLQLNNLAVTLVITAETVEHLDDFMKAADEITSELKKEDFTFDFTRFMDDIESTVQMKANNVHWKNLKHNVELIMSHPNTHKMRGCAEYLTAVLDWSNWGELLTNSAIEHAELLRDAVQQSYSLIDKRQQAQRYNKYADELKNNAINRQQMTAAMSEQLLALRLDTNNALFSFCQAFFYENMKECKPEYKPSFGGSLTQLLDKINAALKDSLLVVSPPSTVNRRILIKDRVAGDKCVDFMHCPIHAFRKTGVLTFRVSTDFRGLADLARYRVREIILDFLGARMNMTTSNEVLKVSIESSGVFQGKDRNKVYNFVTRPLSLTFEYEVESRFISINADVYAPYRSIVQHITPYTTWVIRQSEYSRDIDLSSLTGVRMQFKGSAINDELHGEQLLAGEPPAAAEAAADEDAENELKKTEYRHSDNPKEALAHLTAKGVRQSVEETANEERFADSQGQYY